MGRIGRWVGVGLFTVPVGVVGQDPPPAPALPDGAVVAARERPSEEFPRSILMGEVRDPFGRPLDGVVVEARSEVVPSDRVPFVIGTTGADGRFAGLVNFGRDGHRLCFVKEGYADFGEAEVRAERVEDREPERPVGFRPYTLRRELTDEDWAAGDADEPGILDAEERVAALREVLAASNWRDEGGPILPSLFDNQADWHDAARRLAADPVVGAEAREWLDTVGDPADAGLFPLGRELAPKFAAAEEDLVAAIRATARHVHFFSSRPEPDVAVESINLTPNMDRAMVRCGVNLGPFTGVFWQFVFHKEGRLWVLRSIREMGRG